VIDGSELRGAAGNRGNRRQIVNSIKISYDP